MSLAERTLWLITVEAHDGGSPGDLTLTFSDAGYVSKPTDTPANTVFEARVVSPGSLTRSIFAGGTTFGRVEVGYGAIRLANPDGALDALRTYGWGRRVTVQSITARLPERLALTEAVTRFTGIVSHVEADFEEVRLIVRDELGRLDIPLQESEFAGTSTGATGIEGNANVEGQVKPMAWGGALRNVTPALANFSKEAYALRFDKDGNPLASTSLTALRNGGAPYTLSGTDHANQTALFAATVTSGQADTCLAESLLRTSGSVTAGLTADVTIASAADATAAQIAVDILAEHGFTIDSASVTALDTANNAVCGLYVDQPTTVLEAAQAVLESIGGYLIATKDGTFKVGRFEAPSGTVRKAITDVLDDGPARLDLVPTDDGNTGIPAYKVVVNYAPNFTVQDADALAGSVSADDRQKWGAPWLKVTAEDSSVRTQHPEARTIELDTFLVREADAAAEATRRLAFLKSTLIRLRLPLPARQAVWDSDGATPLDIGDRVTVELDRFGLSAATDFVVIGLEDDFEANLVTLDVVSSSAW